MEILILTGMSGAGKTQTVKFLEDMGYFCIDNLPTFLLPKFGELYGSNEMSVNKFALVLDVRGGDFVQDLLDFTEGIRNSNAQVKILFLECSDNVLISRHSENKKLHPLAVNGDNAEAIARERHILEPLKADADYVIDTTNLTAWDLKKRVHEIFGVDGGAGEMIIKVVSFGYKYSVPANADLMFDVRFLPNPYYVPELRPLTGNSEAVSSYVMAAPETGLFMDRLADMLDLLIPLYVKERKQVLVIAIGCTGGRHRSVTVANELTRCLADRGLKVSLTHRDIGR